MELRNNTILITGGGSGIGLELAKKLVAQNNKVLICGRNLEKLLQAKNAIPEVFIFQCDISVAEDCAELKEWIYTNHSDLNVLVNNAAIANKGSFLQDDLILEKANSEMETNFLAPVTLCKLLLPLFLKKRRSTIINITTGLVYTPRVIYPYYNATKAALHSFTKVLRVQLMDTPVEIIEVLLPAVNTPWHKGDAPKIAISVEKAVSLMLKGLESGKEEIRIGKVKLLYFLARLAPSFAFRKINNL